MKKLIKGCCLCGSLLLFFLSNTTVVAEENGGGVQTEAVITFYEGTTASTTASAEATLVTKKIIKLPQTGEKEQPYVSMGSILLAICGLSWGLDRKGGRNNDG